MYVIHVGAAEEDEMDFSRIQPRDWMIAIAAFVAGAFIF